MFETKNRLSEICDSVVRSGEPVVVTRHGKALVRIVPANAPDEGLESVWDTVAEGHAKYGELREDILLPARELEQNRKDPLDDRDANPDSSC